MTEWHVEVQQTRKPMDADRTKGRTGRKHQKQPRDAEEEEPLALAGLSELHGPTSPSPSTSSSVPFLPLYSGSGQSCTHPLALDVSYTFRVRGVNAVGHSAFCYSPPLSAATRLPGLQLPQRPLRPGPPLRPPPARADVHSPTRRRRPPLSCCTPARAPQWPPSLECRRRCWWTAGWRWC